jgi:hypothetical protein
MAMKAIALFAVLGTAMSCNAGSGLDVPEPVLLSIPETNVAVGNGMTFYGANFFPTPETRTDIQFDGQFVSTAGEAEAVHGLRVRPHREDGNTLVWNNVGPFANPFSASGDRIGRFTGTATAVTRNKDGTNGEAQSRPLFVDITIAPSLVIKAFQPKDNAVCSAPVVHVLGSFAYVMTLEATGFTPVSFTFTISGEPGVNQPRIYRVPAEPGKTSITFGADKTLFFFEPVPLDLAYYVATLDVNARGADGQSYGATYNFGIHNPIEYITTGAPQTAEVYQAQSVSDCYAGGVNGTMQTWTESMEESESRQVGTHWDQSFLTSHSVSNTHEITNGVTLAVEDSTTAGWSSGWNSNLTQTHEQSDSNGWNWGVHADASVSVTAGVDGKVGIPDIAEVGANVSTTAGLTVGGNYGRSGNHETSDSVTGSYGQNFEANRSNTHSVTVGRNYSESDTEGWTYEQSQTVAKGGDEFWQVSSSSTTTHSMEVNVLPGQQAMVYRQRVRLETPGMVVLYDLCGEPQVAARTSFTDWTWSVIPEQGPSCPPPPVHLPAPNCFIGCGGGQ